MPSFEMYPGGLGPSGGAITSSEVAERGPFNAVDVEFIPSGASPSANFAVLDSGSRSSGFNATVDTSGAVGTISAYKKIQVVGVCDFVRAQATVMAGVWGVRVTPVNVPTATTINATVSGVINQGTPNAGGANAWPVVQAGALPAGTNIVGKTGIDQTTPGTTNGVQINAPLPAGTNIVGKTGIDQTTPGTTNGVQINAALPAGTNLLGQVNETGQPVAAAAADVAAPAANTAAVVTYAADATHKHVTSGIAWSYGVAAPTGGNLGIQDGSGNTVFTLDITASGPGVIEFPQPKAGAAVNTAMIITLAAGGATVVGKVSILNHWLI